MSEDLEGRIPQKLEFLLEHLALERSYCLTNRGARKNDNKAYYLMATHCRGTVEIEFAKAFYHQAVNKYSFNGWTCGL